MLARVFNRKVREGLRKERYVFRHELREFSLIFISKTHSLSFRRRRNLHEKLDKD